MRCCGWRHTCSFGYFKNWSTRINTYNCLNSLERVDQKEKKYPMNCNYVAESTLLMKEVGCE